MIATQSGVIGIITKVWRAQRISTTVSIITIAVQKSSRSKGAMTICILIGMNSKREVLYYLYP